MATKKAVSLCAVLVMGVGGFASQALAQVGVTGGRDGASVRHVNTVHELSFAAAQALLAKGLTLAAERELRLSIAIVDRAGDLLAFARMDGAAIVTIDVATGKARTAAFLRAPSKLFEDMINGGAPLMATTPGLLPLQGGMPVVLDGETIGAVGVSGSSGDNDQAMATLIAEVFSGLRQEGSLHEQ